MDSLLHNPWTPFLDPLLLLFFLRGTLAVASLAKTKGEAKWLSLLSPLLLLLPQKQRVKGKLLRLFSLEAKNEFPTFFLPFPFVFAKAKAGFNFPHPLQGKQEEAKKAKKQNPRVKRGQKG